MARSGLKSRYRGWLAWWFLLLPVWVAAAEPIATVPTAGRAVALTFDDGPSPRYTPPILQLLAQYRARATFFVLGAHAWKYPALTARIAAAGHELGNHTWSHPHLAGCDPRELAQELGRTELALALLGLPPGCLFRPPYSEVCAQLKLYLEATHRRLVLWTIDAGDYLGLSGPEIAWRVLQQLQPGAIIVFHDSDESEQADRRPTIAALELLLPYFRDQGWDLVTVSELLARGSYPRPGAYQAIRSASPGGLPSPRHNP